MGGADQEVGRILERMEGEGLSEEVTGEQIPQ